MLRPSIESDEINGGLDAVEAGVKELSPGKNCAGPGRAVLDIERLLSA